VLRQGVRWFLGVLLATSAFADDKRVELATLHAFPGVDLVESVNDVTHDHYGPPAKVHQAFLNFEVLDTRAHQIEVRSIAVVVDNCGKKKAKGDVKPRKLAGHELYAWDSSDPIAKGKAGVRTPPGKPDRFTVEVEFASFDTTRACGFAIDIVVDRVRKQIELPLRIIREEPSVE
jgi:hypothetical protein